MMTISTFAGYSLTNQHVNPHPDIEHWDVSGPAGVAELFFFPLEFLRVFEGLPTWGPFCSFQSGKLDEKAYLILSEPLQKSLVELREELSDGEMFGMMWHVAAALSEVHESGNAHGLLSAQGIGFDGNGRLLIRPFVPLLHHTDPDNAATAISADSWLLGQAFTELGIQAERDQHKILFLTGLQHELARLRLQPASAIRQAISVLGVRNPEWEESLIERFGAKFSFDHLPKPEQSIRPRSYPSRRRAPIVDDEMWDYTPMGQRMSSEVVSESLGASLLRKSFEVDCVPSDDVEEEVIAVDEVEKTKAIVRIQVPLNSGVELEEEEKSAWSSFNDAPEDLDALSSETVTASLEVLGEPLSPESEDPEVKVDLEPNLSLSFPEEQVIEAPPLNTAFEHEAPPLLVENIKEDDLVNEEDVFDIVDEMLDVQEPDSNTEESPSIEDVSSETREEFLLVTPAYQTLEEIKAKESVKGEAPELDLIEIEKDLESTSDSPEASEHEEETTQATVAFDYDEKESIEESQIESFDETPETNPIASEEPPPPDSSFEEKEESVDDLVMLPVGQVKPDLVDRIFDAPTEEGNPKWEGVSGVLADETREKELGAGKWGESGRSRAEINQAMPATAVREFEIDKGGSAWGLILITIVVVVSVLAYFLSGYISDDPVEDIPAEALDIMEAEPTATRMVQIETTPPEGTVIFEDIEYGIAPANIPLPADYEGEYTLCVQWGEERRACKQLRRGELSSGLFMFEQ